MLLTFSERQAKLLHPQNNTRCYIERGKSENKKIVLKLRTIYYIDGKGNVRVTDKNIAIL